MEKSKFVGKKSNKSTKSKSTIENNSKETQTCQIRVKKVGKSQNNSLLNIKQESTVFRTTPKKVKNKARKKQVKMQLQKVK